MISANPLQILKWMAKPNTDIQASSGKLTLVRRSNPSPSTEEKVELISQFLSANQEEICRDGSCLRLISALKEKLISEAKKDSPLIQKIITLSYEKQGGVAPPISVVKSETPIKLGLIFESNGQLSNASMFNGFEKLLMHHTPVVVNREFMLTYRHRFFTSQLSLQWYHQKGGNFTVILPKGKELKDSGFNQEELVLGTFKELLFLEIEEEAKCLNRLLLFKPRVDYIAGHGNQETIAGLSLDQFLKVQEVLFSKGVQFGILDTCFAKPIRGADSDRF